MKLRSSETVKRTWTQEKKNPKHTNVWEWEETPEVRKALEVLHAHKGQGKEQTVPKRVGKKTREN